MVTVNCFLSEKEVFIVRKKSHILLARYLADQMPANESLQSHRKAFCLGNILPDIQPSFVTKRHEYFGTFDEVQGKIRRLVQSGAGYNDRVFWRRSGEVMHYIADYFTFPHNCVFTGSIREHCIYEKKLKFALRSYIRSGEINVNSTVVRRFTTPQQLCDYVIQIHQQYLKCNKTVESDCRYIVALCHVAVAGILNLLEHYRNSNPVSAAAAA